MDETSVICDSITSKTNNDIWLLQECARRTCGWLSINGNSRCHVGCVYILSWHLSITYQGLYILWSTSYV